MGIRVRFSIHELAPLLKLSQHGLEGGLGVDEHGPNGVLVTISEDGAHVDFDGARLIRTEGEPDAGRFCFDGHW